MTPPGPPEWPELLARWHLEPVALAVIGILAIAYWRGYRSSPSPGPDRRALWFAAGLGVIVVALMSPVGTYADALLSVHMVQHLLLVLVAAPLLVAARPLSRLLACLPNPLALEVRGLGDTRLGRLAGHPLVAWVLFAGVGWAVHFSPLFDLALRSAPVHAAEHALFLGAGLLFWRPVLGEGPLAYPLRLLYLAVAMPQNTFLALAISSAGEPLYETYGRLGRTWGPSLLADQRQAGGLMWVAGDVALLIAVLAVAGAWGGQQARQSEEDEEDGAEVSRGSAGPPPSPRTAG